MDCEFDVDTLPQMSPDIGGVDATSRISREASFNGADGVDEIGTSSKERIPRHFGNTDQPVCAAAVASHLLLDGAATLLYQEGNSHSRTFIHSFNRPRLQMLLHEFCNTVLRRTASRALLDELFFRFPHTEKRAKFLLVQDGDA
jgi:hypothetical protein